MNDFWILITRRDNVIIHLYCPHFNRDLIRNEQDKDDANRNLQSFITMKIEILTAKSMPQFLNQKLEMSLSEGQEWICVNVSIRPGFWSKALPISGQVANASSITCGAIFNFMLLMIAVSRLSDQPKPTNKQMAFSIYGALLEAYLTAVLYTFSDTSQMLATLGQYIDQISSQQIRKKLCCKNEELISDQDEDVIDAAPLSNKLKIAKRLIDTCVISILISDAAINSIDMYASSVLIIENYLKVANNITSDEDVANASFAYKTFVLWPYLVGGLYSSVAFEASFSTKLSAYVFDYCCNSQRARETQRIHDADSSAANPLLFRVLGAANNDDLEARAGHSTNATYGSTAHSPSPNL